MFPSHLISKLRDDADLTYLSMQPKTGKKDRPAKCRAKVDVKNLDRLHFNPVENVKGIIAYSGMVYSKALGRNILLVVEQFLIKGNTTYRLLFSTDTKQAPIDAIDIYHTRFQMEFVFSDAKLFAGLENSQAKSGNKLNFHFNSALTTVNFAKIMQLSNPETREKIAPEWKRFCETGHADPSVIRDFILMAAPSKLEKQVQEQWY